MDVVVAGGHGQIGQIVLRLLAERGDTARGLIRNPAHGPDLEALGATPVVCDLEDAEAAAAIAGADAVAALARG